MKKELVERVAEQIGLLASQYGADAWPRHAARYALALAERAAKQAIVGVDDDWHMQVLAEAAVERAVEGGA